MIRPIKDYQGFFDETLKAEGLQPVLSSAFDDDNELHTQTIKRMLNEIAKKINLLIEYTRK